MASLLCFFVWEKKKCLLSLFLFSSFVSFLLPARLPGSCFADSYGWACWDIQGPSESKDWGLIEQLRHICFPSCTVIRGFITGMLYSKPAHCILMAYCLTSVWGCISMSAYRGKVQHPSSYYIHLHPFFARCCVIWQSVNTLQSIIRKYI